MAHSASEFISQRQFVVRQCGYYPLYPRTNCKDPLVRKDCVSSSHGASCDNSIVRQTSYELYKSALIEYTGRAESTAFSQEGIKTIPSLKKRINEAIRFSFSQLLKALAPLQPLTHPMTMRTLKSHPILGLANSYLVDGAQPSSLSYL